MKREYIIPCLLITFTFLTLNIYSQKREVGFHMGYGNTHFDGSSVNFILGQHKDFGQFYTLGFHYFHSMKGNILMFKTGLDHNRRIEDNKRLNYLSIPLGVDFNIGKKLTFVFGGGFYGSFLIAYNGFSEYSDFEETKHRVQIGAYYHLGLGFQMTEKLHLSIMTGKNNDISLVYQETFGHHGGQYTDNIRGFDGYIELCLRYCLFTGKIVDQPQ